MSKNCLAIASLFIGIASSGSVEAGDYFAHVKTAYESVFTGHILSANTVSTADGTFCFFKYAAETEQVIRGPARPTQFSFYSQLGLTVGDGYLFFFSPRDAREHRIDPSTPANAPGGECYRQLNGDLLLYNEIHHIERVWTGKALVTAVKFNDAAAEVDAKFEVPKTEQLVDIDYVISSLSDKK